MKNYEQYDKMNKEEKTKQQTALPKINVDYSKELGSTISEDTKTSQASNNNSSYTNKNTETDSIFNLADGKNQNILANPENLLKRNKVESAVNKVYEPMLAKSRKRNLDMPKGDALKTKTFLNTLGYTGSKGNTLKEDDVWDDDAKIALEKYVGSGVPKQEVFDLQKTLNENGIPDKDGKPLKEDGKYGIKTDSAVYNARNMFGSITEKDTKPVKATTTSGKSYTAEYPLYNPENKPRMLTDEELWGKYSDKYTPQQLGFVDDPFEPNQVKYAAKNDSRNVDFQQAKAVARYNSLNETERNNINNYFKNMGYSDSDIKNKSISLITDYAAKNHIDSVTAIKRLSKISNAEEAKSVYVGIRGIAEAYGTIEWDDDTKTSTVKLFDGTEYAFKEKDGKGTFIGSDNKMYISVLPNSNGVGYTLPSLSGNPNTDLLLYKALGEVGNKEKGINSTKYGAWYYGREVDGKNYMWCANFVSWCANETGTMAKYDSYTDTILSDGIVPQVEGCIHGKEYYKQTGRLYEVNNIDVYKELRAGDVFYHGDSHTGIVLAVDLVNKKVYTIEGNTDDMVDIVKRDISYITEFGSNGGTTLGIIPTNEIMNKGNGRIV